MGVNSPSSLSSAPSPSFEEALRAESTQRNASRRTTHWTLVALLGFSILATTPIAWLGLKRIHVYRSQFTERVEREEDGEGFESYPTLDEAIRESEEAEKLRMGNSSPEAGSLGVRTPPLFCPVHEPQPWILRESTPPWTFLELESQALHSTEITQGLRFRNGDVLAIIQGGCEDFFLSFVLETGRTHPLKPNQALIRASRLLLRIQQTLSNTEVDLPLERYATWLLDRSLEKPPAPYPYLFGDEITRDPENELLAVSHEVDLDAKRDRLQIEIRISSERFLEYRHPAALSLAPKQSTASGPLL